jgi:hypothetical protein
MERAAERYGVGRAGRFLERLLESAEPQTKTLLGSISS